MPLPSLAIGTTHIDPLAGWAGQGGVIISVLDLTHESAHLLLHQHVTARGRDHIGAFPQSNDV
jgi:hypothetical protein